MLIDSTLREGEQRFGAYFSAQAKHAVLDRVAAVGVEEIEAGCAGRCPDTPALVARARAMFDAEGRGRAVSVWCAAREPDLELALSMRPHRVCLGLPVSDAHIEKRLKTTRADILNRLTGLLRHARALGAAYISVGLEDASRADPDFALDVARLAQDEGAARVRLSDTVGILSPGETTALVGRFVNALCIPVAVHCHDDFGLATANALAALDAGAAFADCAALGIGERAGIAATERLVAYLSLRRGAGYDLAALAPLCATVAETLGERVPPHAPVVGERLFWVESGLHADAQYKCSSLYEPFPPETLGLTRRIALGKKSGNAAVRAKLAELGVAEPADLDRLTRTIRAAAGTKGDALDDAEIPELASVDAEAGLSPHPAAPA